MDEEAPEDAPVTLTTENAARHWDRIVQRTAGQSMNLAVALGRGKPVAVEDDTVILRFAGEHADSMRTVETDASRDTIVGVLTAATDNVRSFRCDLNRDESGGPSQEDGQEHPTTLYTSQVSSAEAREALSNPQIAKVVDLFKGRIVDVKHGVKPTDQD